MGNSQTALSGIHPFKDDSSPPTHFIPPAPIANLTLPELPPPPQITLSSQMSTDSTVQQTQQLALGWTSISSDPQPEKFDELFVVKAPTPPPRRISYNEQGKPNKRLPKQGFLGRGFSSLRTLPRMISRPDLAKIRGFFKRKRVVGEVYPVPPDAEKPSPPSKPEVFHEQDEYFLLRWDPPAVDGGLPIIGYIIQHLELGLPQPDPTIEKDDTQSWFSSEPGQVTSTEVLLNNLIPGTTYQFRVIAENLLGFSQPSDVSKPIVFNPNDELGDYFCPPVIIVSLDETYTVIEHERLVLAVEIAGQPYPIVKWYGGDGTELGRNADPIKYSTVSCGQKRILTIHSVECSDSGVVRCVGENERGVVEVSCLVVVEAPPHIRRVLRSELIKLENPYELTKEEERMVKKQDANEDELIFQSGELARFKFLYSGSPPPNVCVYHEGDLVDGEEVGGGGRVTHERVSSEVTENLITVKIAGVKRTDRGEWTVRLDNVLGEDTASVLVTISDRPSEPGKPDVLQLSDNTVILKWDKPYDDGGCPVSGYVVEYFRSEWGVWLKACTTKNPYTKIRDLIPGSKYTFRVKAENLYGMSEPSEESVEILITDLASTLRSVTGDGENSLLMKTVVEEEEEGVKVEENEPGKQGSSMSLNRVSAGTMTDLSGIGKGEPSSGGDAGTTNLLQPRPSSPHPPRKTLRLDSDRTPSPNKLLKVTLQPHVVFVEDENEVDEEFDQFSPSNYVIPAPPSPRRSPSPVAPPRNRTFIQQPTLVDEEAIALTKSQEFSPVRPSRRGGSPLAIGLSNVQGQALAQTEIHQAGQDQALAQSPRVSPVHKPISIPVVNQVSEPKKLYSRSEIIKSAATNDLDYYLSLTDDNPQPEEDNVEEPEEDPELLKVKEALSKDDHLFDDLEDEEEYEYDFDKLQQEYEEDKKRGVVSRQDSGVSARSAEAGGVSRGESFNEEEEDGRSRSVMSDVTPKIVNRVGSFERAQSEVVRDKPVFEFGGGGSFEVVVKEIQGEELVPPPVQPRRTLSPSPGRGFRGGGSGSQSGSRTMLHDKFTDYIAMKASSRNKKVGSSLRSLSSSRYSSNENVQSNGSKDSGRSSMVQQQEIGEKIKENFVWREFDVEEERKAVVKLERSVSVGGKGLSIFTCVQQRGGGGEEEEMVVREETRRRSDNERILKILECACVSTPEIYSSGVDEQGNGYSNLEHSRSEGFVGGGDVPDSGLKERVLGGHVPGGVDYETEEESFSYADQGLSGISEEGEGVSGEKSKSGGEKLDRELPRDRGDFRLRKRVSFGSSDVEEISWDDGRRRKVEIEGEDCEGNQHDGGELAGGDVEGDEEGEEGEFEGGEAQEGGEEREEYGDDTHADEFEYHAEDEFDDDGEVFEMDVDGIDPRVYTEDDEFEGEEDSGVMYVLLDPEGLKLRDLEGFEVGGEGGRDEKLESLLQKIDQFLGEEEEERGGGFIEEVFEEDSGEGDQRGEERNEVGGERDEMEAMMHDKPVIEEECGEAEDNQFEEEFDREGFELGGEEETEAISDMDKETPIEEDVHQISEEICLDVTQDAGIVEEVVSENATKDELPQEIVQDTKRQEETVEEANLEVEQSSASTPVAPLAEQPACLESAGQQTNTDVIKDEEQASEITTEVVDEVINVRLNLGSAKFEVQDITSESVTDVVTSEVVDVKDGEGKTDGLSKLGDRFTDTCDTRGDDEKRHVLGNNQFVKDSVDERIEPPAPPPRPSTFSYKHYMTERQKTPHHTRSSSRESSKNVSVTSLPTVKEEPYNGSNRTKSPESDQPYKPDMSVYFTIKPKVAGSGVTPLSMRSSTSSLLSSSTQELPQVPCLPRVAFKSNTEDDDPPVSIEEIRARIEQNRIELLKPVIDKLTVEEERPVAKKKLVENVCKEQAPISPFMNYLFNAAFYLMLSPMLFFVDSLYFGLLCLLLVACVHFFFIRGG